MRFSLVPTDAAWLSDTRLRETLLANFKVKLEESVREVAMSREFKSSPRDVQVRDVGDAIVVEVKSGEGVALEKGMAPHQMRHLEGSTVPMKTPSGTIFRKVSSLSLMLGKWKNPGSVKGEPVKQAVSRAAERIAEAAIETKDGLEQSRPPRVQDLLGVL